MVIREKDFRRITWKARGLSDMDIFCKENRILLRKKIRACQLWRFNTYEAEEIPEVVIPSEIARLPRRFEKPRTKDAVTLDDTKHGNITRIIWEEGHPVLIYVLYNDGTREEYEYEVFKGNYTTKGGPTRWLISSH